MRDRGFTLLEVLIALALFSLMLALVFGALQMASRTWEAGEVRAEAIAGRMVLEHFLRATLGQARVWSGTGQAAPFGLEGSAAELSFNAYLPHTPGMAGLQRLTLYLAPGRERLELRVRIAAADGTMPAGEEETRDQVLLEDVLAVRFAYWQEGSPGGWVDRWEGTVLPKAVWVEVVREGESWPPSIVPLRIQAQGVSPAFSPRVFERRGF